MRFLRRHQPRRVVIRRDPDPITTQPHARNRMRGKHLQRRAPDLIPAHARAVTGTQLTTRIFEITREPIATHPKRRPQVLFPPPPAASPETHPPPRFFKFPREPIPPPQNRP